MITSHLRNLLISVLCLFIGVTAQAQFTGSVEQYPTSDYSQKAVKFSLTAVATQVGTNAATLAEAFNAWLEEENPTEDLFFLVAADGTLSSEYSNNGKGFYLTSEGAWGQWARDDAAVAGTWFVSPTANVENDVFAISVGQYPDVLKVGDKVSAKFALVYGGKQATFDVSLNIIAKPEIPAPTTLVEKDLNIVGEKEIVVEQFPRSGYDADVVQIEIGDVVAKLGFESAELLADVLEDVLYCTEYNDADGMKKDKLSNQSSAGAPGFWLHAVKDVNGEETGECSLAYYGNTNKFFVESFFFNAESGVLSCRLGQMIDVLKANEQWWVNLYILHVNKAYRLKYTLKIMEREQGNGVEGMTRVGEDVINAEISPDPTNYTHIDIYPDVDAIAGALGCEIGNFTMQALDNSNNWATSTANNGGFFFDQNGAVVSWGASAYFFIEPANANNYSNLHLGQCPGRISIGEEYSIKLYFVNGKKYYLYNINLKVVPPKVIEEEFQEVANLTIDIQQQPNNDYKWSEGVTIPTDFVSQYIGSSWVVYGMAPLNEDGTEPEGNAKYSKNYNIAESPGFWLNSNGRNVSWGDPDAKFAISAGGSISGKFAMLQYPNRCSIGEVLKTKLFFVNEETAEMVTFIFNYYIVDNIEPTTYTLSIQSGSGGYVSYNGTTISNTTKSFSVESGSSATITITPNSGYRLSKFTVNGTDRTSYVSNNQYTISSINANTTVSVTFEAITYTLSIQSGSGGSVSYNGTTISNTTRSFSVESGSSATITITPNSGYRLSRLVVNSVDRTSSVSNNKYTISNITANTTVAVTFEQIPVTTYTLSIQSGSGGSVSYNGTTISNTTKSFSVESGSSATITITPNSGYRLNRLVVNSVDRTSNVSNNQYTISNITANTTVAVTFEQIPVTTYTLSIQSGSGGYVSYDGTTISNTTRSFSVESGSSATISITPNSGYRLSRLVVNSVDRTSNVSNNQYTISNITANTTVAVTFEQIPVTTYTLSIQSGSGGSVSYNGTTISNTTKSFSVESGSSATISITPNSGYRLSRLVVNSVDRTSNVSNNKYTISNITANTTVAVTFEQIPVTTYTLSIQSGSGGSVSYDGTTISNTTKSFSVESGSSATITITPNSGYRLSRLVVNSTDRTSNVSNNKYTISNITANTTVAVTFEQIPVTTYTLSIQSGSGGSVSYNGTTISNTTKSFSVESGSSATITITPNSGYRLNRLVVNSIDRTSNVSNNKYTISNITANTTVAVTFEQIPVTTYTLSIQSGSGGSVSYNGTTISNATKSFSVESGSSATISISPNSGYKLSKLTVNGSDRTSFVSNNQYTISNITANINLVVTYETITYTLSIQSGSGGSVSYNGTTISNTTKSFSVTHGSSATITITPNSGYRLSRLVVNSTDRTSNVSNNQYTISNITANTTVSVVFEQIPTPTYTLTVTASGNGSATYNGTTVRKGSQSFSLEEGSSATIAFTPDEWHQLGSVKVSPIRTRL